MATDAIFVRDLDGRIMFWSQGAAGLYGWSPDEVMGMLARQRLERSPDQLEAALGTTMQQGFWQGELTQSTKAGDDILVASRWTLIKDASGRPQSFLVVNTNITHITEQKRLEAQVYQAQQLASLGELAGGIAHVGNVLTPVLGIPQILRRTQKNVDASTQEQIDILESCAKRGTEMVRQILTFAQGSPESETTVNIVVLLQEVIAVAKQGSPNSIAIREVNLQTDNSQSNGLPYKRLPYKRFSGKRIKAMAKLLQRRVAHKSFC